MAQLHVRLHDDQKSRWEDHVAADPTLDGMSDLVRTAVETYIAAPDRDQTAPDPEIVGLPEELEDINSRLGQLEDTLQLLRLENVQEDTIEDIVSGQVEMHQEDMVYYLEQLDLPSAQDR